VRFNILLLVEIDLCYIFYTLAWKPIFVSDVFDVLSILQFVNIQRVCDEYSRPREGELSEYNSHKLSNFGHWLIFWYI